MLPAFGYDLRRALFVLLRDRGFAIVAVLSIGLGVGAGSTKIRMRRKLPLVRPIRSPRSTSPTAASALTTTR